MSDIAWTPRLRRSFCIGIVLFGTHVSEGASGSMAQAAGSYDECTEAIYLGTAQAYGSCIPTAGSTAGTTASGGACGAAGPDVWYYISTSGTSMFIDLVEVSALGLGVEVLEGSCEGNGMYCGAGTSHTVATTPGQIYYLRVFSSTAGDFTVCISAAQPNDECGAAQYLGWAQPFGACAPTAGTTAGTTASGGACGIANADAWYAFSAPGAAVFIDLGTGTAAGVGVEVLQESCEGTSIYCGAGTSHPLATVPGQTYYLRVFSSTAGDFTVCISAAQPNDECGAAQYLGWAQPFGACAPTAGTTAGTTASGGACGAANADAWYSFSAPGTAVFIDLDAGTAAGMGVEVLQESCEGTSIFCGAGISHTLATVPGQTYYLRVFSSTAGDFTVCISAAQPNDECGAAQYLGWTPSYGTCSSTPGTTSGSTPSGGACHPGHTDTWYHFQAAGPVVMVHVEELTASGTGIELITEACAGQSMYCSTGSTHYIPVQSGGGYFLRIHSTDPGDFLVCVSLPPEGVDCLGIPDGPALAGSPCNDADPCTANDTWMPNCECVGEPLPDANNNGVCDAGEGCPGLSFLDLRVFLDGAYDASSGLMNDGLRAMGLLPGTEPYTALGFAHVGAGGGEQMHPSALLASGNDAIVDWVVVELRDPANPGKRIQTRSALLQRDGDVRDMDNLSPVLFCVPPQEYLVSIRHRNHLGIMTARSRTIVDTVSIDLTDTSTTVYRANSRKEIGGVMAMWAGDVSFDGTVRYVGNNNDRDPILQAIGGSLPTSETSGYSGTDVDLNGITRYVGISNDRDPILQNVGGSVPTSTRSGYLPKDSLRLRPRIHIVDSLDWVLDTIASNMNDHSTLVYSFAGGLPDVLVNDIVVGPTGTGYMRKVTAVAVAPSSMTLQTTQAFMSDIFESGTAVFAVNVQDSLPAPAFMPGPTPTNDLEFSTGFDWDGDMGAEVRIDDVVIGIDYDLVLATDFGSSGLESAELAVRDVTAGIKGKLVIALSGNIVNQEIEHSLHTWRTWRYVPVGPFIVPFCIVTELKAVGEVQVQLQGAANGSFDMELEAGMDLGARYENGAWHDLTSFDTPTSSLQVDFVDPMGQISVSGNLGLKLSTRINGVAGPYFSAGYALGATGVCSLDGDCNYSVNSDLKLRAGIEAEFADSYTVDASFEQSIPFATFNSPDSMYTVSGNGQAGSPAAPLAQPLRVKVVKRYDPLNRPATVSGDEGVRVHFTVMEGGGAVDAAIVETNEDGYAECVWTLGDTLAGVQKVRAYVLQANGDTLGGASVLFIASTDPLFCPYMTDADGNTYTTVRIGNRCWTAANLRTTRYRDGSTIPNKTDGDWMANEPARCAYDNDAGKAATFGYLYNGYAIMDPRCLCPQGWHVSTESDWQDLELSLGMPVWLLTTSAAGRGGGLNIGGKLKALTNWDPPNTGATNELGFGGLPAGQRFLAPVDWNLGRWGLWWSPDVLSFSSANARGLGYQDAGVLRSNYGFGAGLSVRCVKD